MSTADVVRSRRERHWQSVIDDAGFAAPPRHSTAVAVDRDSALGSLASGFLARLGDLGEHTDEPGIGATTVSLLSAVFAGVGSAGDGRAALRRRAEGIIGDRLGVHRHSGAVSGFCLEGSWRYLEYDRVATPGGYVHENLF